MEKIEWVQERLRDDFAANQALRAQFRVGTTRENLLVAGRGHEKLLFQKEKRELNEKRAQDAELRARCSLSIPLVPEDPNDRKVAGMLLRYRGVDCKFGFCIATGFSFGLVFLSDFFHLGSSSLFVGVTKSELLI